MEGIQTKQNDPGNLLHFAASRHWYRLAKLAADTQTLIAVCVPLACALIAAWFKSPDTKVWTTFAALSATLLEVAVLDNVQRSRRTKGAVEQEVFDCVVLKLKWSAGLAGAKPEHESSAGAARASFNAYPALNGFRNWYPPEVSQLPHHLGRFACQRGNAWWDATERNDYARILRWLSIVVAAIVVVIGLARNTKLGDLVATVYAPLSPLVVWGIKEHQRHAASSELSIRLYSEGGKALDQALSGLIDQAEAELRSRDIQNGIFQKRATAPFVPNWAKSRQKPSIKTS